MKYVPPWLRIKPKKDAYLYKDSLYRLTQVFLIIFDSFVLQILMIVSVQYFNHRNRNCWRIARTYWEKTQQRNIKLRKEQRRNFIDLYSQRVLAALSEHEFPYRDFTRAAANVKCTTYQFIFTLNIPFSVWHSIE